MLKVLLNNHPLAVSVLSCSLTAVNLPLRVFFMVFFCGLRLCPARMGVEARTRDPSFGLAFAFIQPR
jgi:hypothetical protein